LKVFGNDFGFVRAHSDAYKKEQAEKAAKLIGENYDRFEHLKLGFELGCIGTYFLNYLEEHHPGVKLNK
jgi:hypothetical protein